MLSGIAHWISARPIVGLLVLAVALAAFGSALGQAKDSSPAFWPWLRRIVEASVKAILLFGLIWAFQATLSHDLEAFGSTHESALAAKRRQAEARWGKPIVQDELAVYHFVEVTKQEVITPKNPAQPKLYRNVPERQLVPQNSVIGFRGNVTVTLDEREMRETWVAAYTLNARYEYEVMNHSDLETEAEFKFPLVPGHTFERLVITADGQDISPRLQFAMDSVSWKSKMKPQQQSRVVVTYASKGTDQFLYRIPVQRELRNSELILTVSTKSFYVLIQPENDLMRSDYQDTEDRRGAILTWKLDRVIMAPQMGIALRGPQAFDLYNKVKLVLGTGPTVLTLLGAMLALTLLIGGQPVRLLDLALVAGVCCVQFLILAGLSDYVGFGELLLGGAALAGGLIFCIFRPLPSRWLHVLIYALAGFFGFVYPRSGLYIETQRNVFEGVVQAGLIVYLFGLSLYARLQAQRVSSSSAPVEPPRMR